MITSFREWPSWQRVTAIAVGLACVLALVRLPEEAGAVECKGAVLGFLPNKVICTGYNVASDAIDGVSSTSHGAKQTVKSASNATDGLASTTEGAAKLLDKANNGIDHIGQWWKDAQARRQSTTTAGPLPPIRVVSASPSGPAVPVATTAPPTTTARPSTSRGGVTIVAPDGTRLEVR